MFRGVNVLGGGEMFGRDKCWGGAVSKVGPNSTCFFRRSCCLGMCSSRISCLVGKILREVIFPKKQTIRDEHHPKRPVGRKEFPRSDHIRQLPLVCSPRGATLCGGLQSRRMHACIHACMSPRLVFPSEVIPPEVIPCSVQGCPYLLFI